MDLEDQLHAKSEAPGRRAAPCRSNYGAPDLTKPDAHKFRILPINSRVVVYPGHGAGRSAKLDTCRHCGGKPLILRRCNPRRTCAVCSKCGFHHHMRRVER